MTEIEYGIVQKLKRELECLNFSYSMVLDGTCGFSQRTIKALEVLMYTDNLTATIHARIKDKEAHIEKMFNK